MSGTTGPGGTTASEPTGASAAAPLPPSPFRERLWPAAWVWGAAAVVAGFAGIVALPFGGTAGAVTAGAALAVLGALLVTWSPVVAVDGDELVAGRAHVPVGFLGEVAPLDAAGMREALGPGLDLRAYLCTRGWVATGVRVELTDPDDPTPYWVVSTRRPQRLVDAARQACRQARPAAG